MSHKIKTLLFSTLYPSSARPVHGIFVETRLRELLKSGRVETQVVAPVPWFPSRHPAFGSYAKMAATPQFETRNGIQVHHPRYFLPPKVGQNIAPYVLAAGALPSIRRLIRDGFDFDVIDAHFYYPDGVAASIIAEKLGKPFVCTARGSDITLYKQSPKPNRLLRATMTKAAANIGVCVDLVEQMIELGASREKSLAIRNGVDLQRFSVVDRKEARKAVGIDHQGLLLLSVGNLIELKGHHLLIEMMAQFPEAKLAIVGAGPMRSELQALAASRGVAEQVIFAGQQANDTLKNWFSAADALLLASSREGWANVLLESMACGTPVVATRVNGTPEVVASLEAGRLADVRDVEHLKFALQSLLADYPARANVRRYAENFSWDETTRQQIELFSAILEKGN
ncbi:MAG: glycosyltransferase family 4 protein [Azonexus sp.]|nr:glycosyltransferase family 4 protein [Azonexus sp.]MDZ4313854.1 glycosyltransferase family 4 protein [Azonexus sp.]